ncbi:hypothetical protein ABZT08_09520 [Streptomyces sp. NPDC005526]|uniref:hypothetical protein n=1 Tax=Streptomyces sp. NPDC005526 TaxID=3156885 RepID=UPI0033A1DE16
MTTQQETRPHAAAKPVRWAADVVATMREGARLRLDYSAPSLWRVDRIIADLRREETPYAAVESVLRALGAYAGEVIVRQADAEWSAVDGGHRIRTADGRLWDPIDEARRCFAGHGSLRLLCRDATAGAPAAAPAPASAGARSPAPADHRHR